MSLRKTAHPASASGAEISCLNERRKHALGVPVNAQTQAGDALRCFHAVAHDATLASRGLLRCNSSQFLDENEPPGRGLSDNDNVGLFGSAAPNADRFGHRRLELDAQKMRDT